MKFWWKRKSWNLLNKKFMLSKDEVKHIANLARLGLTETELKKYEKELSSIFDYIGKLEEIDLSDVEPTSHPLKIENVVRKDETSGKEKDKSKELLNLSSEVKDGYFKVKSVLE